jgi:hypothetical protein
MGARVLSAVKPNLLINNLTMLKNVNVYNAIF